MKITDLTVVLDENASIFPDPKYKAPELTWLYTPETDPLKLRYSGHIKMHLHTGTHMDTPKHAGQESSVDDIDLNVICGKVIVVKLPRVAKGPITVDMVEPRMPEGIDTKGMRLLLMCGYNNDNWGKDDYFSDSAYVSPELAQWVVDKGFALVGLDMLTDGLPGLPTHRILLGAGVYILECLTNYEAIPEGTTISTLITAPLPLAHMEAAPVRAFLMEQ